MLGDRDGVLDVRGAVAVLAGELGLPLDALADACAPAAGLDDSRTA